LLRRRSKERALFGTEAEETAAAETPDADGFSAVLTAERAAGVNAAVAKLPERYRVPLALAYYADADYDEIATALGITRTHVGVLLCRAKQQLRQLLAEGN
jgi:RNA polymerase sigma factor (sigma-70 family)